MIWQTRWVSGQAVRLTDSESVSLGERDFINGYRWILNGRKINEPENAQ
jgi:hypothetical protein